MDEAFVDLACILITVTDGLVDKAWSQVLMLLSCCCVVRIERGAEMLRECRIRNLWQQFNIRIFGSIILSSVWAQVSWVVSQNVRIHPREFTSGDNGLTTVGHSSKLYKSDDMHPSVTGKADPVITFKHPSG